MTVNLKMTGRSVPVTKISPFLLMDSSSNLALGNLSMRKFLSSVLALSLNVSQICSFLHLLI